MHLFLRSIPLFLLLALLASLFFWPHLTPWISLAMLAASIAMAIALSARQHWQAYRAAECTRERMVRDLLLDLLGFLLAMGAAVVRGRDGRQALGPRAGLWAGLLAGFAGGFLAAWAVRSAWGRLVTARLP
jgi:hypothetical protein